MTQDTVTIEIDGRACEVARGAMVIEAADAAGIAIPRFCYHKKLTIAANCRMCLVEVERAPKPLPACATPVMDGHEGLHDVRHGPRRPALGDGVLAHQSSPRLPHLRPGRGVRAPGPRHGLRARGVALHRTKARGSRQEPRASHRDRHDPLHPLHPLRAIRRRGGRASRARGDRARRGHAHRDLHRAQRRLGALGERHRRLPGGGAHLQALPVQGARLGDGAA